MDEIKEIVYLPNEGEAPMAFLKRVVAEQSDREPLRIASARDQKISCRLF